MVIGNQQCSSTNLFIINHPYFKSYITSVVSSSQVAGEYNLSTKLSPGNPIYSQRNMQTSYFTGRNYTQRIVPQISNFSTRRSGIYGTIVNVTGIGFSSNVSDFSCTVSG